MTTFLPYVRFATFPTPSFSKKLITTDPGVYHTISLPVLLVIQELFGQNNKLLELAPNDEE
jgi:hypothetical protein